MLLRAAFCWPQQHVFRGVGTVLLGPLPRLLCVLCVSRVAMQLNVHGKALTWLSQVYYCGQGSKGGLNWSSDVLAESRDLLPPLLADNG